MVKFSWDAGHGGFGVTPGKRTPDGSMYEWDFNNAVVRYGMEFLSHYEGVEQFRADDPSGKTDVPLKTRTSRVNAWGANAHISVHANAAGVGWGTASGIETYIYKTQPKEAHALALNVHNRMVGSTGRKNRGVKSADFQILRETNMTSILVECGFMTNAEEAALLKSEDYRVKIGAAIAEGIAAQYGLQPKHEPQAVVTSALAEDHPYRVVIDNITHAQAREIVILIGTHYKNAKAEGQAK